MLILSKPFSKQFQTLCESSRLYEPGSQYVEFIRRMPLPPPPSTGSSAGAAGHLKGHQQPQTSGSATTSAAASHGASAGPYAFEPYSEESLTSSPLDKERKSNGSLSADSNDSTGTAKPI